MKSLTITIKNSKRSQLRLTIYDGGQCRCVVIDHTHSKIPFVKIYINPKVTSMLGLDSAMAIEQVLKAVVDPLAKKTNASKLELPGYTFDIVGDTLIFMPSGLPGGLNDERKCAYALSTASIATGLFLIANPAGWVVAAIAGTCMGMGLGGATYTASTDDSNFKATAFAQQAAVSGVGGFFSGGIASGASVPALLASGAVGAIGSKTTETLIKENRLPNAKEIVGQAALGTLSAGVGASASQVVGEVIGPVGDSVLNHFCKGGVQGAVSGMATKVVDNVGHNLTQKEEADKKELLDGLPQAALQGCLVSGLVAASKQAVKTQDSQKEGTKEITKEVTKESNANPQNAIPQPQSEVSNRLDEILGNGFQPSDPNLKNSSNKIIEQIDQGHTITLKHHSQRIKLYRDGDVIVLKLRGGETTRINAPIGTFIAENLDANQQSNSSDNTSPQDNNEQPSLNVQTNVSSPKGMKVYFFSRPLKGVAGLGVFLNEEARHVGFIIDHPEKGLIVFENDAAPGGKSSFVAKSITEFRAQTTSEKGCWLYEVGVTNSSLDEIMQLASNWIDDFPKYKFYSDNCRRFLNEILRKLITEDQLNSAIKFKNFIKNPCKELEKLIRTSGFNVAKHLTSNNENVSSENRP